MVTSAVVKSLTESNGILTRSTGGVSVNERILLPLRQKINRTTEMQMYFLRKRKTIRKFMQCLLFHSVGEYLSLRKVKRARKAAICPEY